MNKTIILGLNLLLIFFTSCTPNNTLPEVDLENKINGVFSFDKENKIILYNGNSIAINNNQLTIENIDFEFVTPTNKIEVGKAYKIKYANAIYTFFVTELPIVSINLNNDSNASALFYEQNKETKKYFIAVETPNHINKSGLKPSYKIKLRKDSISDARLKQPLLKMANAEKWILNGINNQPLYIRDYTAQELWLKITGLNNNAQTKKAVERKFVELFVNNTYQGIYWLGEYVNEDLLQLKKSNNNNQGELYFGLNNGLAVTYSDVENFSNSQNTWSGYQMIYPNDPEQINWENLFRHVSFVAFAQQSDFNTEIEDRINVENAIDYFLLMNILYGQQNTGKNIYTAKSDSKAPYYFIPYNLNATLGINEEGLTMSANNEILSNELFNRLLINNNYKTKFKNRWKELRSSVFNNKTLTNLFYQYYMLLKSNGVYDRSILINAMNADNTEIDFEFIEQFIINRTMHLDSYFDNL